MSVKARAMGSEDKAERRQEILDAVEALYLKHPDRMPSVAEVAAIAQDADTVTLNFVNADIDAVVKAVGEIPGRNFLVDPRVKAG